MLYIKKILIISLFSKDITEGADLTLVFMDELNDETNAMSYDYEMADNKTTILIKRDALFATEHIAHEIGHVLGAGHGPDISKLKLKVPYSDALVHRGRNQKYSFQIDLVAPYNLCNFGTKML